MRRLPLHHEQASIVVTPTVYTFLHLETANDVDRPEPTVAHCLNVKARSKVEPLHVTQLLTFVEDLFVGRW